MGLEKHPHSPEFAIKQIDQLIEEYERHIAALKVKRKQLLAAPPVYYFPANPSLTKDLIRKYMRQQKKAAQTVEVVNNLFPTASDEEKTKAIKTLSVIFNTLEKEGTVKIEKTPGVKGNFYTWIGDDISLGVQSVIGMT